MARHRVRLDHADDGTVAGKLYGPDRHSRNHPHHDAGTPPPDDMAPRRSTHIERVSPGEDPTDAINRLYSYGRHYPHSKPHDAPREPTLHSRPASPSHEDCYADYEPIKNSPVSPAPDESQPQFRDSKASTLNDAYGWVRGFGSESPYPKFDAGPSGHRYRK
jgi:hypothetical protein